MSTRRPRLAAIPNEPVRFRPNRPYVTTHHASPTDPAVWYRSSYVYPEVVQIRAMYPGWQRSYASSCECHPSAALQSQQYHVVGYGHVTVTGLVGCDDAYTPPQVQPSVSPDLVMLLQSAMGGRPEWGKTVDLVSLSAIGAKRAVFMLCGIIAQAYHDSPNLFGGPNQIIADVAAAWRFQNGVAINLPEQGLTLTNPETW